MVQTANAPLLEELMNCEAMRIPQSDETHELELPPPVGPAPSGATDGLAPGARCRNPRGTGVSPPKGETTSLRAPVLSSQQPNAWQIVKVLQDRRELRFG